MQPSKPLEGFTKRMNTESVSLINAELKEPGATRITVVVPIIFRVVSSPVGMADRQSVNSV